MEHYRIGGGTWLFRITVLVALLVVWLGSLGRASEYGHRPRGSPCTTVAQYTALTRGRFALTPGTVHIETTMRGKQLTLFLDQYNKLPPVTNLQADTMVVYQHRSRDARLLAWFKRGCLVHGGFLGLGEYERVLHQAGMGIPGQL